MQSEIKGGKHHLPKKTALAEIKDGIKRAKEAGEKYDPSGIGRQWTHNFLNQKPWHPFNIRNQIRLYDAEQAHLHAQKAKAEAEEELRQEREQMQTFALLDPAEAERQRQRQSVSFMYVKPPGLDAALERDKKAVQASEQAKQAAEAVAGPSQGPPTAMATQGRSQRSSIVQTVVQGIAAARAPENFSLKQHVRNMGGRSPIRGGLDAAADNQQFVLADVDDEAQELQEPQLDKRQQRKALKRQRQEAEAERLEEAKRFLAAAGLAIDEDIWDAKPQAKKAKSKHRKKEKKKKRKRHTDTSSGTTSDS